MDKSDPRKSGARMPPLILNRALPVGGLEVAGRLGVKRETVAMWKQRGLLPPARWTVSGEDAWDWYLDIEPWARQTGRLQTKEANA